MNTQPILVTCPQCEGKKYFATHWDGQDPVTGRRTHGWGRSACQTCQAAGQVTEDAASDYARRTEAGEKLHELRRHPFRSCNDAAQACGVSPIILNRAERGFPPRDDAERDAYETIRAATGWKGWW